MDRNHKVEVIMKRFKKLSWKVALTDIRIDLVGLKDNLFMAVLVTPNENAVELKTKTEELLSRGFDRVVIFPQKDVIKLKVQIQRIKDKFELEDWKMVTLKPRPDFIAIEHGFFTAVCLRIHYTNIATNSHTSPYQNKSWYKNLKERHLKQGFEKCTIFVHHRPRHSKLGDLVLIPVLNEPKTKLYRPVYT